MASFLTALAVLVIGYVAYGALAEKVFGIDPQRPTPAIANADGVDFIPMPTWKVFLIQFLNIAGLGPIFGAIMGIMFGPAAFLWIVLGTIFAGAVHDFTSAMISVRSGGQITSRDCGYGARRHSKDGHADFLSGAAHTCIRRICPNACRHHSRDDERIP